MICKFGDVNAKMIETVTNSIQKKPVNLVHLITRETEICTALNMAVEKITETSTDRARIVVLSNGVNNINGSASHGDF